MQVNTENKNVRTNINDAEGFTIDDSPVIFQMFSNTIYENKREAVVREVLSNAVDSHGESGTNRPVKVTLPNYGNQNFVVEDFGVGLSLDEFKNTFTCYTKSPKRLNNNSIGGFGIGAKSPYAYTNSFYVRTRKDGQEHKFMCYMNENSEPVYKQISSGPTSEPNGVEVTVPVKSQDHYKFQEITAYYTSFFDMEFDVQGYPDFKKSFTGITRDFERDGYSIQSRGNYYDSMMVTVVMGGVPYPYKSSSVMEVFGDVPQSIIRGKQLFVPFDIGELKVSLSRESLSLDEQTDEKVINKLTEVASNLMAHYQNELDSLDTLWEAYEYIEDQFGGIRSNLLSFKGDSYFSFNRKRTVSIPNASVYTSEDGRRARYINRVTRQDITRYARSDRKIFVVYRNEDDPKAIQKYGKLLARTYEQSIVITIRESITETRKSRIMKLFHGISVFFLNIKTLKNHFDSASGGKSGIRGKVSEDTIIRGVSVVFDPSYMHPVFNRHGPVDVSVDKENTIYLYDESVRGKYMTIRHFHEVDLNTIFSKLDKKVVLIGKNNQNEIRITKKNQLMHIKDFMVTDEVQKAVYKAIEESVISSLNRISKPDLLVSKILDKGGDPRYHGTIKQIEDIKKNSNINGLDSRGNIDIQQLKHQYTNFLNKEKFFDDLPKEVNDVNTLMKKICSCYEYVRDNYKQINFHYSNNIDEDLMIELVKALNNYKQNGSVDKAA